MWTENDNQGFANEEDYLRSLKKDDSYTLTYQFEYIAKNYGNDNYDIETEDMVVTVEWDDTQAGYVISYNVPNMHRIDPGQGNSDAEGFYESAVYSQLMADLEGRGIGPELIVV